MDCIESKLGKLEDTVSNHEARIISIEEKMQEVAEAVENVEGRYYSIETETDFTNETDVASSTSESDVEARNELVRLVEIQLEAHSEKIPFSLKEFLRFGFRRLPTDALRCFSNAFLQDSIFTWKRYKQHGYINLHGMNSLKVLVAFDRLREDIRKEEDSRYGLHLRNDVPFLICNSRIGVVEIIKGYFSAYDFFEVGFDEIRLANGELMVMPREKKGGQKCIKQSGYPSWNPDLGLCSEFSAINKMYAGLSIHQVMEWMKLNACLEFDLLKNDIDSFLWVTAVNNGGATAKDVSHL
jgi:hypothetical protein